MKTKNNKAIKKIKVTANIKNAKTKDLVVGDDKIAVVEEEVEKIPEVLGIHPKKPSPRSPKFQDSEYISELDRDFGFDLSQDPLAEDL